MLHTDGPKPLDIKWALIPLVIALLAHGVGLGSGFAGDDSSDIIMHPVVNGSESPTRVLAYNYMGAPIGEGINTIRPLTTLLFAVEWRLWGDAPWLFHLVSVVLFLGLVWACQALFRRIVSPRDAVMGAAIFASLAIHVDSVGLIANRAEVLSALFAVTSIIAVLERRVAIAAIAYVLALLSKESAVLMPLTVAWYFFVAEGPSSLHPRKRGWVVLVLLSLSIVFVAARSAILTVNIDGVVLHADNTLQGQPIGVRTWVPLVLLGRYLELTLAPIDLSFDYTYDAIPAVVSLGEANGWIGVAFVVMSLGLIATWWRRRHDESAGVWRVIAFATGAFFISYALFSNTVFLIVTVFAERLFLVPSMWLVLMLIGARTAVKDHGARASGLMKVLFIVIIAVQVPFAAARSWECRDNLALFSSQVMTQPNSVKGHLRYAQALSRAERYEEALWHLGLAISGRSTFPRRWSPPTELDRLPLRARLLDMHQTVAPEHPQEVFWQRLRSVAGQLLGPGATPLVDELIRAARARQ